MTTALMACMVMAPATRTLSVYGDQYIGRKTADGTIFTQNSDLCASNDWPLGTKVRITFNGKSKTLTVRDRMHKRFSGKRVDLPRKWFVFFDNKPDGLHKGARVEVLPKRDFNNAQMRKHKHK